MDDETDYGSLGDYLRLTSFIKKMLISIGFNVLAPNYKAGVLVVFMYATIFSFLFCMGYSVVNMLNDYEELLKCMAVFGVPIKGFVQSTTLLYYASDLYRMHMEIVELHRNSRGVWSFKLKTWTRWMDQLIKGQCSLYVATGLFLIFFPLFYNVMNDERMLLINVMVPFLDPKSDNDYIWISIYEVYCSFLSTVIFCTGDSVFLLMCFSAATYFELVKLKFEYLNKRLREVEQALDGNVHRREISKLLVSTVIASHKADEFAKSLKKIYNFGCLIQIYTSGLSLAICVLAGKMTPWLVAYPMGLTFLYAIMAFSFVGTVLETKGDDLSAAVYDIDWYLLPVTERRIYLLLLAYSQRTTGITLMGSRRLNVETGMSILNTIYSGYMMLDGAL